LRHGTGIELRLLPNFPHLAWNGELLQLAHAPYLLGEDLFLPLQVLVELFPRFLPNAYAFDSGRNLLTVFSVGGVAADRVDSTSPNPVPAARVSEIGGSPARPPRILIIDAGHGGSDPGAIGPGGTREADLALSLALALAREFEGDPELEVRLTRARDVDVPLWSRGEMATEWKGDRPGVFLSIHMNALGDRPGIRGFETYFLSPARDEHERRVAALENASLPPTETPAANGTDLVLTALLRDLQAFDHQHWSADLAEVVQRELRSFHPGADRGVKQGPFAVITNSLMPSVLLEVGFITSPEEERLLRRTDFQRDAAQALARAVRSFFLRYPPGGSP
jgi:N-acetylmuramoyl-L-alanine amidase